MYGKYDSKSTRESTNLRSFLALVKRKKVFQHHLHNAYLVTLNKLFLLQILSCAMSNLRITVIQHRSKSIDKMHRILVLNKDRPTFKRAKKDKNNLFRLLNTLSSHILTNDRTAVCV